MILYTEVPNMPEKFYVYGNLKMQRPNILLIYVDQHRWDALGANGNPYIHTPNLDQLAMEGANFDHCFVQNALCMPSRASFLTGQYPSQLDITHMGVDMPEDAITWPRLLRPYGYFSANMGKLHFLNHANRDHRIPHPSYGFDQWEISDEPGVYEDAYRAWVRREAPDQLEYLSVGLPPATAVYYDTLDITDTVCHSQTGPRDDFVGAIPFPGDDAYTHSAFVAQRTMDFLKGQDEQRPFLCIAGFYSPHAPWVVPQRYLDLYDPEELPIVNGQLAIGNEPPSIPNPQPPIPEPQLRSAVHGYYAMISEVDNYVGQIMATLAEKGLVENTIVIYTSDHGEWLGDNGRFGKGYPGDDPTVRVPFIIKGLDIISQKCQHLIEAVDVLPTLLELAGIQSPPHLNGRSFAPQLLNRHYQPRDSALTEFHGWKTLRTHHHRYLIHDDGQELLWDDKKKLLDPAENLDVINHHRHLLLQRLLEAERPLPRTWPY